jgi:hypothetical protein
MPDVIHILRAFHIPASRQRDLGTGANYTIPACGDYSLLFPLPSEDGKAPRSPIWSGHSPSVLFPSTIEKWWGSPIEICAECWKNQHLSNDDFWAIVGRFFGEEGPDKLL